MVEAVGHENLPAYFGAISSLLKPGGQAVIQVSTLILMLTQHPGLGSFGGRLGYKMCINYFLRFQEAHDLTACHTFFTAHMDLCEITLACSATRSV